MNFTLVLVSAVAGTIAAAPVASAQGQPPGTVSVSTGFSAAHTFVSDFDRAGDVQCSSMTFSGGITRQFVPAFWAGVSARGTYEDWRFGSPHAFDGPPWGQVQRLGAGVNLNLALSPTLVIGVGPGLEWAYDPGADIGDALMYGATVNAVKAFSTDRVLGVGTSVYRRFYSVKTSPFVIVNWRITDRVKIANAHGTSPEGGGGIELRFAPDKNWEIAGGGVIRSDRYRLADHGRYAGGVGEVSNMPVFARLSRNVDSKSRIDLYVGALVNNSIKVRDSEGHELASDHYRPAPATALTIARRF